MQTCAFFGHRDLPSTFSLSALYSAIERLIRDCAVSRFFSCNRGGFDVFAASAVSDFKKIFPYIRNTLVLSFSPEHGFALPSAFDDWIYPIEKKVPTGYAVSETNKLIINKADYIITAVSRPFGGAFSAYEYALKSNKNVINLLAQNAPF